MLWINLKTHSHSFPLATAFSLCSGHGHRQSWRNKPGCFDIKGWNYMKKWEVAINETRTGRKQAHWGKQRYVMWMKRFACNCNSRNDLLPILILSLWYIQVPQVIQVSAWQVECTCCVFLIFWVHNFRYSGPIHGSADYSEMLLKSVGLSI